MSAARKLVDLAAGNERLSRALETHRAGGPDLVALVRSAAVGSGYQAIAVTAGPAFPTRNDWEAASFEVVTREEGFFVTPRVWAPVWGDRSTPPDVAAASGAVRQSAEAIPADAYLPLASGGHTTYRTMGQEAAIRAVLDAKAGDTVVAVLPTGSGKTLAATVPAYLAKPDVTVVIVPTVSLALDLERRIIGDYGLSDPVAYHGGLTAEDRQAMRERLRNRSQWIVITSPEAATTSLAPTLEQLAVEGRLGTFVIDEAHIVSAWGGAFRPAFQGLAGLRRRMVERTAAVGKGFVTVLLTGTLDQHGLRLLQRFFAEGEATLVLAQATRPEPSFWTAQVEDDDVKQRVVVDALRHLPRPAIVYTSLVQGTSAPNAYQVRAWLAEAGFERVALVAGDSSTEHRQRVVAGLRCAGDAADDIDVVVASSAFGLGVDIENVRSIVHVCIPESIDRYYQEVGRAGRDGRASVSLVVHGPSDVRVAERLASPGDIGVEKAWARWVAMRRTARTVAGRSVVSLHAAHQGIVHAAGDLNEDWNLHTLTVMELAGMVRLQWRPPASAPDDLDDDGMQEFFDRLYQEVEVELCHGDLDDRSAFEERFAAARSASGEAATTGLDRVRSLLGGGDRCHNDAFADAYRLVMANDDVIRPVTRCGGCPACRAHGRLPKLGGIPVEPYVRAKAREVPPRLVSMLGARRMGSVVYAAGSNEADPALEALLRRVVQAGSRLFVTPNAMAAMARRVEEDAESWVAHDALSVWLNRETPPPMVTTVVLPPNVSADEVSTLLKHAERVPGLLVVHEARQPGPPGDKRLLRELIESSVDLTSALRRV